MEMTTDTFSQMNNLFLLASFIISVKSWHQVNDSAATKLDAICGTSEQGVQHPSTISLSYNHYGNQKMCNGALITFRHILTAAHCLVDLDTYVNSGQCQVPKEQRRTPEIEPLDGWSVTYNGQNLNPVVAEAKMSPKYDACLYSNDIAVLELDQDILFDNALPICLPDGLKFALSNEAILSCYTAVDPLQPSQQELMVANYVGVNKDPEKQAIMVSDDSKPDYPDGTPLAQYDKQSRQVNIGILRQRTSKIVVRSKGQRVEVTDLIFEDVRYAADWIHEVTGDKGSHWHRQESPARSHQSGDRYQLKDKKDDNHAASPFFLSLVVIALWASTL